MPLSHHWHTMMMAPYWQPAQIVGVWYFMMFGGNPSHWQFCVHTIAQRWGTLHLSFTSLVSANCFYLQIILFSGGLHSKYVTYWFNTSTYMLKYLNYHYSIRPVVQHGWLTEALPLVITLCIFSFSITLLANLNPTILHCMPRINGPFL
jgi:hypothetical protein